MLFSPTSSRAGCLFPALPLRLILFEGFQNSVLDPWTNGPHLIEHELGICRKSLQVIFPEARMNTWTTWVLSSFAWILASLRN